MRRTKRSRLTTNRRSGLSGGGLDTVAEAFGRVGVVGCRRLALALGGELVLLRTSLEGEEDERRREDLCLGGEDSTGLRRGDGN